MEKYKKTFFDFWDIGEQDIFICQSCNQSKGIDIHHLIFRSQGGGDNIENLICLCRKCHNEAHQSKQFNERLIEINNRIHERY